MTQPSDIAKTARQAADRISSIPNFFGTKARLAKRDEVADIIAAAITKAVAETQQRKEGDEKCAAHVEKPPEATSLAPFTDSKQASNAAQSSDPTVAADSATAARIAEIRNKWAVSGSGILGYQDVQLLLAQLAEAKRDSERLELFMAMVETGVRPEPNFTEDEGFIGWKLASVLYPTLRECLDAAATEGAK